jgi:5-methylcytosine-specific restriction endonuclease McrA
MYKDNVKFDKNGRTAKKIKRVLNFLYNAFPEKIPELRKQNVVSLYLLVSELLEKYAISNKEATLRDWFIEFEKERREEEENPEDAREPDWIRYQETIMQAVDSKASIEFRHKMLMTSFLLYYPELEPLDSQRAFTDEQRVTMFRKYKGICQRCSKEIKWDEFNADHIVPFSKGGKTTIANGQLLCASCNITKGAK